MSNHVKDALAALWKTDETEIVDILTSGHDPIVKARNIVAVAQRYLNADSSYLGYGNNRHRLTEQMSAVNLQNNGRVGSPQFQKLPKDICKPFKGLTTITLPDGTEQSVEYIIDQINHFEIKVYILLVGKVDVLKNLHIGDILSILRRELNLFIPLETYGLYQGLDFGYMVIESANRSISHGTEVRNIVRNFMPLTIGQYRAQLNGSPLISGENVINVPDCIKKGPGTNEVNQQHLSTLRNMGITADEAAKMYMESRDASKGLNYGTNGAENPYKAYNEACVHVDKSFHDKTAQHGSKIDLGLLGGDYEGSVEPFKQTTLDPKLATIIDIVSTRYRNRDYTIGKALNSEDKLDRIVLNAIGKSSYGIYLSHSVLTRDTDNLFVVTLSFLPVTVGKLYNFIVNYVEYVLCLPEGSLKPIQGNPQVLELNKDYEAEVLDEMVSTIKDKISSSSVPAIKI